MSIAGMSPQGINRYEPPDSAARSVPASGQISDDQVAEIVGRLQRHYPRGPVSPAELERRVRVSYRLFDAARSARAHGGDLYDAGSDERPPDGLRAEFEIVVVCIRRHRFLGEDLYGRLGR